LTEPESGAASPARTGPPQLDLSGHVGPERAAELCARVGSAAKAQSDDPLHCGVGAIEDPDIGTVDTLARMALTARRLGRGVELVAARPELRRLIAFAGLADVLRSDDEARDSQVQR
jgi:hypothetical protein